MGKITEDENHFRKNFPEIEAKRKVKWDEHMKKRGFYSSLVEDKKELFNLIKNEGIPECYRNYFWIIFSGAFYKSFLYPRDYYYSLLSLPISEDILYQIQKDCHRSFPDHHFFQTVCSFFLHFSSSISPSELEQSSSRSPFPCHIVVFVNCNTNERMLTLLLTGRGNKTTGKCPESLCDKKPADRILPVPEHHCLVVFDIFVGRVVVLDADGDL